MKASEAGPVAQSLDGYGHDGSHYHRGGPSMDTRTLLLLTIVAVIVGYVAYRDPAVGTAIAVAVAVVTVLAYFIKEDDSK